MKNTPLHWAVLKNNIKAVQLLLEKSKSIVNINLKDSNGLTPLNLATKNNQVEIIRLFHNYEKST